VIFSHLSQPKAIFLRHISEPLPAYPALIRYIESIFKQVLIGPNRTDGGGDATVVPVQFPERYLWEIGKMFFRLSM
jgi:hypothetical protein